MGISKRKLHAERHILPWRPLTDLRHENDTFAWNKASFIAQEGGGWVPEPLESSHGYATEKGQKHTLSHDHLLLMTSYLLTIGTEYHYTAVLVSKCALGINEQPLNTSGADVLSSRENIKKTSDGGGGRPEVARRELCEACSNRFQTFPSVWSIGKSKMAMAVVSLQKEVEVPPLFHLQYLPVPEVISLLKYSILIGSWEE